MPLISLSFLDVYGGRQGITLGCMHRSRQVCMHNYRQRQSHGAGMSTGGRAGEAGMTIGISAGCIWGAWHLSQEILKVVLDRVFKFKLGCFGSYERKMHGGSAATSSVEKPVLS